MTLRIMNSREKKKLAKELREEYGVKDTLFDGRELLQSNGDAWITTRECLQQNLEGLKIDSIGLQAIRGDTPTVHGVQLLFNTAELTELSEEEARRFTDGEPLNKKGRIMSYKKHPIDLAEKTEDGVKRRE